MKDELGGKIIKEFAALKAKLSLKDNDDEDNKAKGTKNVPEKEILILKIINSVYNLQNKINQLEKNKVNVYCLKEFTKN